MQRASVRASGVVSKGGRLLSTFALLCLPLAPTWLVACADRDRPTIPPASLVPDAGQGRDLGPTTDAGADSGPGPQDGGEETDAVVLRGYKEPCEQNADCRSGWCIPFSGSYVCTRPCQDSCSEGWFCRGVVNTGSDPVFICMPPDDRLCYPCVTEQDCSGGLCLTIDPREDRKYCTQPCLEGGCREGYSCTALRSGDELLGDYCMPDTGSCTCSETNGGMDRLCTSGNELGLCLGRETCDPEDGWVGCDAPVPDVELCNLKDDDCNGFVDDVAGLGEACTREATLADGPATCRGVVTCVHGESAPSCTARVPQAERCNLQDDDCDDQIDEDFPELGQACSVGAGACLRIGSQICDEAQGGVRCSAVAAAAQPEQCNHLDDDCDGATDEDFLDDQHRYVADDHCGGCGQSCAGLLPNATARCDASSGSPACVVESCDPGFYLAGANVCLPFTDPSCQVCADDRSCGMPGNHCLELDGERVCGRDCGAGNLYATDPGWCPAGYTCQAFPELGAGIEQCVPVSASCRCLAGEDLGLVRSCLASSELGTCAGVQSCDPVDGWSDCSASPPEAEACNGQDDDCDGVVDEQVVVPEQPCLVTNELGVCGGSWRCAGEAGWVCSAATPVEESCNGLDDDCDGQTDEGFLDPLSDTYLGVENCGLCGFSCQGTVAFATAVDCVLDEGTGLPACVATSCEEGALLTEGPHSLCVPRQGGADCDPCLEDTHCNGVEGGRCTLFGDGSYCTRSCAIDEDCPADYLCQEQRCMPISQTCSCGPDQVGSNRPCRSQNAVGTCLGLESCDPLAGWIGCTATFPALEACNGQDDDCDRQVDELVAPPDAQGPCEVRTADGVCTGTWVCEGDQGWLCDARRPAAEACDHQDNDCDGQTDEGFRNAQTGIYDTPENCGLCGYSCDGRLPHALTVRCDASAATPTCIVDSCEPGFYRAGDFACVPVTTDRCAPCQTDRNCPVPGDRCLDLDGAKVCGQDCSVGNLHGLPGGVCPSGYSCEAVLPGVLQCLPESGSCSCLAEHEGNTRWCNRSNPLGTCTGFARCDPAAGWADCSAAEPVAEVCNNRDDDCDGTIDEGYDDLGVPCTNGEGACRRSGVRVCAADGQGTTCGAPAGQGTDETCNYQDDDCDGVADEDFRDPLTELYDGYEHCGSCSTSCEGAVLFATQTACRVVGAAATCVAEACEQGFNLAANGRVCLPQGGAFDCAPCTEDNQCDSLTGGRCERFPDGGFCTRSCDDAHPCQGGYDCVTGRCWPISRSCNCLVPNGGDVRVCFESNAAGTCIGTQTCNPDATPGWSGCSAQVPAAESCDGLDNDCNGLTDEGATPPGGAACTRSNAFGTCSGTKVCGGLAGWQCSANVPAVETCNGRDDDCDGLVDENFPELLAPCYDGQGACRVAGVARCSQDGASTVCTAIPRQPTGERCDGADNDCDGSTDEGFLGLNQPCQEGNGVCRVQGVNLCAEDGASIYCSAVPGAPAGAEQCNGLDDNCDGLVDEAFLVNGRIATDDHCGGCGRSCANAIPNATARCEAGGAAPHCVVEACAPGHIQVGDSQCLPAEIGQCDPCLLDGDCLLPGAVCAELGDGTFCLNPCAVDADCGAGSRCLALDGDAARACQPSTGSCLCDGSDLALSRGCEVEHEGIGGGLAYSCFGFQRCQVGGWSACELSGEECNGFDDDCDGQADEDFLDAEGRFASDENCGACGNDCSLLTFPGGGGICNTNVNPPRCSLRCDPNSFDLDANPANGCECRNPVPTDRPDPLGIDANCDGIDGEKDNGVFVAKNGSDSDSGSFEHPKLTIQAAIQAAVAGHKRDVYVATGVYGEAVTLASGVGVFGGYASDFRVRNSVLYEVAIMSPAPTAQAPGAVNAIGLKGGVAGSSIFDGFSVFGFAVRTPGESSYAVYVNDCDGTLQLSGNKVHAGVGGRGGRGLDGQDGLNGQAGGFGRAALDLKATYGILPGQCQQQHWSAGGAAGVNQCPGNIVTSGGVGGNRVCPAMPGDVTTPPVPSENGAAGANGGAAGGAAGRDVFHQAYSCDGYTSFGVVEGRDGGDGTRGVDGSAGARCDNADGMVVNGRWQPAPAGDGTFGLPGKGGGGGGSGGGAFVHTSCDAKGFNYDNLGGTGGGAGSGACGGTNGTAGTGAGGAFGIFVVLGAGGGTIPTIGGNTLFGGLGGPGGDGGNGGTGGSGGSGGLGGAGGGVYSPPDPTYPAFKGGKGGNGGHGGHGGGGGGGCGGPAYDIYVGGAGGVDLQRYETGNSFPAPGAGGPGGEGGFSLGFPGETGLPGAAGATNF